MGQGSVQSFIVIFPGGQKLSILENRDLMRVFPFQVGLHGHKCVHVGIDGFTHDGF